jgi:hypothetical protein
VEDECLDDTWKSVSIDPISDANQNYGTYWERVKVVFDERKLFDPEFNKVHMDRNMSGVGESFKPLATSGMESNKILWNIKKAAPTSTT